MGRPKKSEYERKTHVIPVRLSETQYEIIRHNAELVGMRMMDYIRYQSVHGKVKAEYRIVADLPELKHIARELAAIGNNLNQIARYYNSGGMLTKAVTEDINGCIDAIMQMRDVITEMAGR